MRTLTKIASLIIVGSVLAACGGQSSSIPPPSQPQSVFQPSAPAASILDQSAQVQTPADLSQRTPIFTTLPATDVDFGALDAGASATIPFFTRSIVSPLDHKTYTYRIAGADPHTSKVTTNLTYLPIVLKITFPGGVVLDPTKTACGDTVAVQSRFFNGPNFKPVALTSNGVSVGPAQVNDGDQRAEFWSLVKGTGYHTVLVPAASPIVISKTAPAGSTSSPGACAGKAHSLGMIDFGAYDNMVRSIINAHATTTEVPVVLTYNVVQTSGGCCIIGYHSAYSRSGGTQVYSVGAYTDEVFTAPGIRDIHAWTHEIGELMNDPFVNNPTPAWGHIGQVSGCQNNLEVGDPLTGTAFTVTSGGFTYHPQELAFFDWFFRTPSGGTGAKYSFRGTFTKAQGKCV